MKFRIQNWAAWAESRTSRSAWESWSQSKSEDLNDGGDREPDVSMIPPLQRRRMSQFSKMMVSVACDCIGSPGEDVDGVDKNAPICVFSTRHGELTRTLKIISNIVSETDVSPTDFSMSVHNTALGLFSIFTENKSPSSLIVAGADTFGAAMLEAGIFLQRFPDSDILLVYADEPVPGPINSQDGEPQEAICVAVLLTSANDSESGFSLDLSANNGNADEGLLAEMFLKFFLSGENELVCLTPRSQWRWNRL